MIPRLLLDTYVKPYKNIVSKSYQAVWLRNLHVAFSSLQASSIKGIILLLYYCVF